MKVLMSITFILLIVTGVVYFRELRKKYYRKQARKLEYESLCDMHMKCTYAISQEIVHDRSGYTLDQFKDFYKEICEVMTSYRKNELDIKRYGKLKRSFYGYFDKKYSLPLSC